MTSVEARLAWAIPVSVIRLGAHLQAYVELLPTLTTLRLCNCYGRGEHAVVQKLPMELVNAVEDYLTNDARTKLREDWEESYRCAESRCRSYDHFTKEQQLRAFDACFNDPEDPDSNPNPTYLNDNDLDKLDDALWESDDMGDEASETAWRVIHDAWQQDWNVKTGSPTTSSRGFFSMFKNVLWKHLGLEIVILHTHCPADSRGRWGDNASPRNTSQSTSAYLVWPGGSKFEENPQRCGEDSEGLALRHLSRFDPLYHATESSFALPVAMPSKLSSKDLARFTRAMKMLDLESNHKDEAERLMIFAAENDKRGVGASSEEDASESGPRPSLMLLMRVDDEP